MSDTETPRHEQLGAELRHLRERLKLTQKDVAERLGVTNAAISLIERGTSHTSLDRYQALADAVGARLEVILAAHDDDLRNVVLELLDHIEYLDRPKVNLLRAMMRLWREEAVFMAERERERKERA